MCVLPFAPSLPDDLTFSSKLQSIASPRQPPSRKTFISKSCFRGWWKGRGCRPSKSRIPTRSRPSPAMGGSFTF
jgi:hypothetical protein